MRGRTVTLDMHVVVAIEVSEGKEQSPLMHVLMPGEPARSTGRTEVRQSRPRVSWIVARYVPPHV